LLSGNWRLFKESLYRLLDETDVFEWSFEMCINHGIVLGEGQLHRVSLLGGIRYASRLVTEAELVDYINAGWEVLKELSSGRILIRAQVARP
jgi:hypothetical protein